MDEEQRQHLETLLSAHQRRLRRLEQRRALSGSETPINILLEIEDIEAEVGKIKAQLSSDVGLSSMSAEIASDTARSNSLIDRTEHISPSSPYRDAPRSPQSVRRKYPPSMSASNSRLFGLPSWIVIGLSILLLLVLLSLAFSFRNNFNSQNERIVFVSNRSGNNEIYVMNADGTGLKKYYE